MDAQSFAGQPLAADTAAVEALYHGLLEAWNGRNAAALAALFSAEGQLVGFDGSPIDGQRAIEEHLGAVFRDHPTAAYVGKVRGVRFLTPQVAVLRAVAGMIPPGATDLNPAVNAIQTLVAANTAAGWRIELYQNTPAAFHGRPEASEALTAELRALLT